ncbi:MAG: hypothetical protein JNL73_22725 [Anaerolineales bacterium]|nr:hypothetical protein [Anaerolineales bacterium]
MPTLFPILALAAVLVSLVLTERWINRHLQGIWLLIFRDPDVAMITYSLTMLPGVVLHEASHWVVATVLGVRTGRFSVFPERTTDGHLRLGFVETERTDIVREALIGAAPLLVGAAMLGWVGSALLGLAPVGAAFVSGDMATAVSGLPAVFGAPDAWLWLYLLFAVGNAMLPSRSDQRAWLPAVGLVVILIGVLTWAGFGGLLAEWLTTPALGATAALAGALSVALFINALALPVIWVLERLLIHLTGLRVEY